MASGSEADVGLRLRLFGRSEVRRDLRDTQDDLDDTAEATRGLGERALDAAKGLAEMVDGKVTKGLQGLGDAAKTAGVRIAQGLAVGVAAAGAAVGAALISSVVKGIESEGVQRTLQTTLGMTPAEAAEAGQIAGRIYAQNYGESRDEVAAALSTLSRSTGLDVTSEQLQTATRYALDLASAFEVEVGESARAAGQLVRTNLVDTLGEAYDLIAVGFQSGADRGEDFLDTLNEYSTTFRDLGLSGREATGLLVQALNAGVGTADFAADALRETGILVTENSEEVAAALTSIGLNAPEIAKGFNTGGQAAADALDQVLDALRTTDDAALRSTAATAILGGQYEDIGDALLAMDPSKAVAALGEVDGAAARLDSALAQGVQPAFETVQRSIEGLIYGAGAALAQKWGPDVEDVLNRVSHGVGALADDLPGLGSDLATFLATGDLTGLGTRIEAAFGLADGTLTRFDENTTALVTTIRDDVLPAVGAVVDGLTAFAEHKITHTVPILTAVLGFLSQHTEAVTRVVYGGLIAFGLYKAALTVVGIATKVHTGYVVLNGLAYRATHSYVATWIGVKALELAAWVRSTAAAGANTIALGANRVAQGAGYLLTFVAVKGLEAAAWARSTALTVASTVAQGAAAAAGLAVRGATVVATAAQWLFNAALTANPIGLVVAGIALLVGGLVWFFTKTEAGRKAWQWLTDAFKAGVSWITNVAVPLFKVGFSAAVDYARERFDKIRTAVGGFVDKVKDALTWVGKLADKLTGGLVGDVLGTFGVDLEGRASGGVVKANTPYIVGEQGAELFVPGITGTVLPSEALASMLSAPVPVAAPGAVPQITVDDDDAAVTDGLATLSLTVPLIVDGREIARATVNGMHTDAAWK